MDYFERLAGMSVFLGHAIFTILMLGGLIWLIFDKKRAGPYGLIACVVIALFLQLGTYASFTLAFILRDFAYVDMGMYFAYGMLLVIAAGIYFGVKESYFTGLTNLFRK